MESHGKVIVVDKSNIPEECFVAVTTATTKVDGIEHSAEGEALLPETLEAALRLYGENNVLTMVWKQVKLEVQQTLRTRMTPNGATRRAVRGWRKVL